MWLNSASFASLPASGQFALILAGAKSRRDRSWFAPALLGAGWLLLGALAALQMAFLGSADGWLARSAPPVLAGALWVAITFGVTWLTRRVPWNSAQPRLFLAVHVPASLAASFVLNAAFAFALVASGAVPTTDALAMAIREAVQWLHLNAAGYWAVVIATHALRPRTNEGGRSDSPASDALELPKGRGRVRIPHREIAWIEADGDYARVHAGGRSYLLSERMKTLESRLAPAGFLRLHRSAIVNGAHVREVRHRSHGDYDAMLVDGTIVRVSRSRRQALNHLFAETATD